MKPSNASMPLHWLTKPNQAKQDMQKVHRVTLATVVIMCVTGLVRAESARSDFDYPIQTKGCILSGSILVRPGATVGKGVGVMYRIGQFAETKHGRWKCVHAIAKQSDASLGGVWVKAVAR